MNTFAKISTISLFFIVCLCNALESKAAERPKEDWFLIEAKFSKRDIRISNGEADTTSQDQKQATNRYKAVEGKTFLNF